MNVFCAKFAEGEKSLIILSKAPKAPLTTNFLKTSTMATTASPTSPSSETPDRPETDATLVYSEREMSHDESVDERLNILRSRLQQQNEEVQVIYVNSLAEVEALEAAAREAQERHAP